MGRSKKVEKKNFRFKHCHLMETMHKQTPILLLDDIIEHLDEIHKRA